MGSLRSLYSDRDKSITIKDWNVNSECITIWGESSTRYGDLECQLDICQSGPAYYFQLWVMSDGYSRRFSSYNFYGDDGQEEMARLYHGRMRRLSQAGGLSSLGIDPNRITVKDHAMWER
jgi:hypothetical protein